MVCSTYKQLSLYLEQITTIVTASFNVFHYPHYTFKSRDEWMRNGYSYSYYKFKYDWTLWWPSSMEYLRSLAIPDPILPLYMHTERNKKK